ncbi:MAG: hypothetical protein KC486_30295 [Myxococcales bacterium]|nr:hypothetical protein [Myxococcales bacterium]
MTRAASWAAAAVLAAAPTTARAASPIGEVVVTCDGVEGWALDPDDPGAAIDVHLYFDGPAGDQGATGLPVRADRSLPGCQGDACGHGFTAALPLSRLDGQAHPVHAYGIDGVDPNLELSGSPGSYSCPPLALVEGVRRHVLSPELLGAWRFSIYWDLMKVADVALAGAPTGPSIGEGPVLVSAAGDEAIWLIDQGFRRPMPADVLAAWRFTAEDVAPIDPGELAALPEGSSPPPRPVLVQGSGAAVFLLDAYQCAPGDDDPACAGDATTTGGDATTDGEDTSTGGEDTSTGSGTGSTGEPDATTAGDMTDGSTGAATGPSGGTNSDGATTTGGGDLDGSESDGCACRANDERPGAPLLCLLPVLLASRRRW